MLAIFRKSLAHPPEELNSPTATHWKKETKQPQEILRDFHLAHPTTSFSASFSGGAALASAGAHERRTLLQQRLFCSVDDVYCMFLGRLDNLSSLIRQYGLSSKSSDEALLVIEAYRTLRDRGPYPADQVIKDLVGSFAFVVFDNKAGSVFAALSSDGEVELYWGIAAEGSVVISDEVNLVKSGCGKSFAPFPPGCMFHSEGGLKSFERPMNKMKAMPRVDSEGAMCGAFFKVDSSAKINSMPRVGSAANWSSWVEKP
ncbi:hypothetical protein HPP92_028519 [Vanilla planifolia]|uniref:DUF3700 domain-containing protein n=1 Tax=Vanilla planifolia TaxID=51239 RepID=A0A835P708_VANPL|nr:hypothetical protein HPP92_028519 [Vanilla planifolia]